MNNWGSIPDWISVVIAFLALIGFVIVERERLILKGNKTSGTKEGDTLSNSTELGEKGLTENNVDIRAEIYSRILIGVIFGLSLTPILDWATHNFFYHTDNNYALEDYAENVLAVVFSFLLSTLFTFIYYRAYSKMASVFVHWAERLTFSYLGFWLIFSVFSYWTWNSGTEYFIRTFPFITILVSVIMFLLIGFSSTPVDWIIYLVSRAREKSLPNQKTG